VPVSRLRLGAIAAGLSLLLAAGGFAREVGRFGRSDSGAIDHIEQELARRVVERARALEDRAIRVARESGLVAAAANSRDLLPDLFASLARPLASGDDNISSTVWIPAGSAGGYRVLAWSGSPAEDVAADVLARAPALTVAPGAGGLRLIYVNPIQHEGRRIAVASTESAVAVNARSAAFPRGFALQSSVGSIPAGPVSAAPLGGPGAIRIRISSSRGEPLLDAAVTPTQIATARRVFRWRTAALALLPWIAWLLVTSAVLVRRRPSNGSVRPWLMWTGAGCGLMLAAAALLVLLGRAAQLPPTWIQTIEAVALLAIVAAGPASAWWRRMPRAFPRSQRLRWILENLAGGAIAAGGLIAMALIWRNRLNPTSVENWQLPMLASDFTSLAAVCSVLLAHIAVSWTIAGVLGVLAGRWEVTGGRLRDWGAVLFWVLPSIGLTLVSNLSGIGVSLPFPAAVVIPLAAAMFGVLSLGVRRHYRTTSEARRLVFRFVALLVPVLAVYPLAAASAELATRDVIERDYGPATLGAQQPASLMKVLTLAEQEVDALPHLEILLRRGSAPEVPSLAAFTAWAQTVLSRDRITSEVELYGPDKKLVSRFSLNVPEFGGLYPTGEAVWQGTGCDWANFAEVARSGPDERPMLHAERGVCAPDGTLLGAVVLHLIPDYRSLRFASSANPYYEVLDSAERTRAGPIVTDLQLVVYGWNLHPVFVSGRVAWLIDNELDQLLYQSRQPFWRDRMEGDRLFHIYFMNDRAAVYAIGYPSPTALQHVTRLAEAAAVLTGLFLAYLAAATLTAPLWRGRPSALGKLFHEIRASFYRKLFLFFVLAAVGPVALFAITFGSYMADKLRADVEFEASSVVIVARRVFDELSAAQARPGQARAGTTDDVMVWIRQMVDQDVNLYDGPQLAATSQRDLFDSGLLPMRTPASVYRDIVLNRRPVSVTEDRIGRFSYLVAAAPVLNPAYSRETILTVPLATRQREIEREIDELTRGVLAGTVLLVVFAAALGASVAARVSDPVARLTRATRLIAAGRLDERLVADTADELGRLVEDFNSMTDTLVAQRAELARANQLKAWAEMSRQVAHEVKNPLTPIQLAAEHLQRVHEDQGRPLGPVVELCLTTILKQVKLLRRIASEFSTFATQPTPRMEPVQIGDLLESVVEPYRPGLPENVRLQLDITSGLPIVRCDRTQMGRALTNLVENALQAMPNGGSLHVAARSGGDTVVITVTDTGAGMDAEGARRAFEPYFSTKTGGSGLGLANAKRIVESSGGSIALSTAPGQGTTVTITLPAVPPGEPASE
jgi:signal transduction histidine kinase